MKIGSLNVVRQLVCMCIEKRKPGRIGNKKERTQMEQKAWIRKRSDVTAENQTGMKHSANRGIEIREKNGVTYLAFPPAMAVSARACSPP